MSLRVGVGVGEKQLGVLVWRGAKRQEALLWSRELGKVELAAEEGVSGRAGTAARVLPSSYRLGAWLRFWAVPTSESANLYRAVEAEAWVSGTDKAIQPLLRFNVFGPNEWEVQDALGFVLNVNEKETTVWSEELGLVTAPSKGARSKPALHSWLRFHAEFRQALVSEDYQTNWEMTEWAGEERPRLGLADTAVQRRSGVQASSAKEMERGQGLHQTAFVLDDGSHIELHRHVYHVYQERSGQFLFALAEAARRETDGKLRLSLLLVHFPGQRPHVLYAVPKNLLRDRLLAPDTTVRVLRSGSTSDLTETPQAPKSSKPPPKPLHAPNLLAKVIPKASSSAKPQQSELSLFMSRTPDSNYALFSEEAHSRASCRSSNLSLASQRPSPSSAGPSRSHTPASSASRPGASQPKPHPAKAPPAQGRALRPPSRARSEQPAPYVGDLLEMMPVVFKTPAVKKVPVAAAAEGSLIDLGEEAGGSGLAAGTMVTPTSAAQDPWSSLHSLVGEPTAAASASHTAARSTAGGGASGGGRGQAAAGEPGGPRKAGPSGRGTLAEALEQTPEGRLMEALLEDADVLAHVGAHNPDLLRRVRALYARAGAQTHRP